MMKYTTTVVFAVLMVLSLADDDDEYVEINFIGHPSRRTFEADMFKKFYQCLCDGTNVTCTASYDRHLKVYGINNYTSQPDNGYTCKYYKCQVMSSEHTVACIQQSPPSSSTQNTFLKLHYSEAKCSYTECVAFSPVTIDSIDYTEMGGKVTDCAPTCRFLSKSTTTVTPTKTPSISPTGATIFARSTATIKATTRPNTATTTAKTAAISTTKAATTTMNTAKDKSTTAAFVTTITKTQTAFTSSSLQTKSIQSETTTSTNVTASHQASASDNQTDSSTRNTIIGVVVALVVVAVAAIVGVLVWRRKTRPKTPTDSHDYVNVSKRSFQNGDTKVSLPSSQPLSNEYSNHLTETTLYADATADTKNHQSHTLVSGYSKSTSKIVLSKAEPLKEKYCNVVAASEANAHSDEHVNNTVELDYESIDNTLDETAGEIRNVYAVAMNSTSNSDSNPPEASVNDGPNSNADNIDYSIAGCSYSENDDIDVNDMYARLREEAINTVNIYDALLPPQSYQNSIKHNANPSYEETLTQQESPYSLAHSPVE